MWGFPLLFFPLGSLDIVTSENNCHINRIVSNSIISTSQLFNHYLANMQRFNKESICEFCGYKKVKGKDREFQDHYRKHLGESYACDVCNNKTFSTPKQSVESWDR